MPQLEFDWVPEPQKRLELLTVEDIFEQADQQLLEALKEDRRLERKPPGYSGEPLGEYLSMWANTAPDGGLICLGMEDNGSLTGCHSLSQNQLNRLEALHDLCPDARCETKRIGITTPDGTASYVVLVRVRYQKERVAKTPQGKAFIRRADRKHKLSAEEVRELSVDKGEVQFEQEPCKQIAYPQDYDRDAIRSFAASLRERLELVTQISDEGVMAVRHLGAINTNGKFIPNIACALLFAKEPDKVIPGCKIRFLRFDGETEGTGDKFNAVKDIWIEGLSVPLLIHKAEQILDSHIRTFAPLEKDKKFRASPEYPKAAWYEAIVNACVHRSYGDGLRNMTIYVKMFDDRLEIESPGPFLPFVTPKNIYGTSNPRNPKLMGAMYFMNFVKMAAEGTRRMRDTMKAANLPEPEFAQKEEISYSRVRVTLRNNIRQRRVWVDLDAVAIVGAALASSLDEKEKRIINYTAEHGKINVTDAARIAEVGWATAKRILERLVKRSILEHHHSDKIERDSKAFYKLPAVK